MLVPGGRLAFYTIFVAPGLSEAAERRARAAGPRAVATRRDHLSLLASAGFADLAEIDLTEAYRETARRWFVESERRADALRGVEGEELFEERQAERLELLAAAQDGLLHRSLFTAERPVRGRKR